VPVFPGNDPTLWHAAARPGRIACIELATGARLTFRELDARVAACAANLGGMVGARVAYIGRNSIDLVVLNIACVRAGAVFVPLNWRLTAPELAALLEDCTPRLLLHDAEFAAAARAAAGGAMEVQDRADAAVFAPAAPVPPAVPPDDAPCTLLYTSGTTGRPKAAIITRAGAFFAALNFAFVGNFGPDCAILSDAPMFHTVGLFAAVRTALTTGATLLISDRFLPEQTLRVLSDPAFAVTHYFAVPRIAATLRAHPAYADADLSRLHGIYVGGAPMAPSLIADFLADGVRIVNGYGMTECGTAMHMPNDAALIAERLGAIGVPGPLIEARVARLDGTEAAPDEVGEVWLRGPGVTPGYWNNPSATAASFQDGWLRTGDAARRDAGGYFWLVDRLKDMYISGGENVYPAEVENLLRGHPGIADVAVRGVPHDQWGESGAAFVVPRDGVALNAADVLAYCDGRLARYKHPSSVRFVEAIPRTASGKIQKHLLRD
jgi:fatty-acyl-CoA synthase